MKSLYKKFFNIVIILELGFTVTTSFSQVSSWHLTGGSEGYFPADIDFYRGDPDTVYTIGLFEIDQYHDTFKLMRSTNQGAQWDSISYLGTDIGAIRVAPNDSKVLFASSISINEESNIVSKSTDGGMSWKVIFSGAIYPAPVIQFDPVNPQTVYAAEGPGYLWRSTDLGVTWSLLDTLPLGYLTDMTISNAADSVLYAGAIGAVFQSTDWGNSWKRLDLGVTINDGVFLAASPNDPNVVYAGLYSTGSPPGGIYKSIDGGKHWSAKNNGLDSTCWLIGAMKINPLNSQELFLGIGTPTIPHEMLYHSTDGGESWNPYGNGLPKQGSVDCISIDPLNKKMCVGVWSVIDSSGIYETDLVTSVTERLLPTGMILHQNYPNPFNPSTVIRYEVSRPVQVSISVLNVLGQRIATLTDEEKYPGSYQLRWDGKNYPSGIFFYQMKTNEFIQTRKMILLK